jgi:hypothetical protein
VEALREYCPPPHSDHVLPREKQRDVVLAGQPYPLALARLCIASPQHVGLDELSVVEQANLRALRLGVPHKNDTVADQLGRIKTLNWKEDIAMLQLSL